MNKQEVRDEEVNLREIIKPYISKWYLFAIMMMLFICLAFLYIKFSTPIYNSKTSVLIKDAKKMSSASGDFGIMQGLAGFGGMGTNSIENEIEIFKSNKLIDNVVSELNLQTSIFSKEKYYDNELYKDTSPVIINVVNEKPFVKLPTKPINIAIKGNQVILSSEELKTPINAAFNTTISLPYANVIIRKNPEYNYKKASELKYSNELYFSYNSLDDVILNIQKSITVELVNKDATIIGLQLKQANKDKAKDILKTMVVLYNHDATNDKNIESKKTKDFIDDRINIISNELGEVETQKERFKVENNIVDLPTEARLNLQLSTSAKAQELQTDAQLQLNNILSNYVNKQTISQVLPTNIGLDSDAAAKGIDDYNKLVLQRNKMLENATPENPVVVELENQIKQLKGSIKEGLSKNETALQLAKNRMGIEIGNANSKIKSVPYQEKLFRNIERQQQIKESLYLLLLQKREEAAIALAMTADKARVVNFVSVDKKLVAPQKMIILLGSLIFGFILPFGYIYLKELFNNKIITKHDLEKLTKGPILSEIPRLARGSEELVQINDVSPLAESFRILVTNLNFLLPKNVKGRKILITSNVKGEGKTFISVNLALTMASPTKKVLIIGSDIRNPQLQRYNPEKKKSEGLTEYLTGGISNFKDIIHQSSFTPYCDIIYSGSIPPNPTDLLENGRYGELLNLVEADYDYIILDSAPLMLVTDSFLISEYADATLYVTRSETTEKSFIDFANNNINSNKIKNVAFVLNDVRKSNFGYGNKYGYGYHAEEKSWLRKLFNK